MPHDFHRGISSFGYCQEANYYSPVIRRRPRHEKNERNCLPEALPLDMEHGFPIVHMMPE